jgi:hypothetical protein
MSTPIRLYFSRPGIYTIHLDSGSADQKLDAIIAQLEHMTMTNAEDVKTLEDRIDAATNLIAARIAALAAQIGTGMTQAEVDAVKTSMGAEADKLEALGKSPDVAPA